MNETAAAVADGTGTVLVSLMGVTKRFGGVTAVEGVDFDLRSGEVHALVGENGAGKSTLMKMIGGLYRPDEGHIEVGGERVEFASARDAASAGIALIPQELELFEELSAAENLYVGRRRPRNRWGGFDRAAMREEATRVFDSLGVELDVGRPVKELSVASRQLVEIGRGLAGEARVLIMDEPTAALSEREASALFEVISSLTSGGVGVVYISHRLEEIFRVADRTTVMRDGKKVSTAPTDEFSRADLVGQMVGRPLSQLFRRTGASPGDVLLEVRGLTRPGAFSDVSFAVRAGEILALSGLIGAGRTEVAQAIYGIAPPTSGEILVRGQRANPRNPAEAQRIGIAYLPEERRSEALILPLPVTDNVTFAGLKEVSRAGFIRPAAQQGVAEDFVERLAIRCGSLRDPVSRLSGGNQQKVALAKNLALEPSILLLDEPTRGVDVGAKSEIYRLIDSLAKDGKAVVVISSEMEEVLAIADRVIAMREGRVAAEFPRSEATQERLTAAAMGLSGDGIAADEAAEPDGRGGS